MLVGIDSEAPEPPLTPAEKGWLTIRARGSNQRLHVFVENQSPDVLRFEKGRCAGSSDSPNIAKIAVEDSLGRFFNARSSCATARSPSRSSLHSGRRTAGDGRRGAGIERTRRRTPASCAQSREGSRRIGPHASGGESCGSSRTPRRGAIGNLTSIHPDDRAAELRGSRQILVLSVAHLEGGERKRYSHDPGSAKDGGQCPGKVLPYERSEPQQGRKSNPARPSDQDRQN
jgi:hypothetical protein